MSYLLGSIHGVFCLFYRHVLRLLYQDLEPNFLKNRLQPKAQITLHFGDFVKDIKKILITFMICSIDGVVFNLFFNTLFPFTDSVTNRAYEFIGTTIALIASYPIFKLAKKWGARKSLQMANIVFMILSSVQFLLNDEGLGIYRLLYVLPGFLYLIPLVGLIPSLFEKSCRAFLVGLSRNISIFLFGGVGLLLMRFYFKPSGCLLAGYILGTALISFWGMHLLPRQSEEF